MDRDIYPDHYYDEGKIPVFCPTMEQFQDFKKFVEATYSYGKQAGIIKIIPPTEWLQSLPNLSAKLENVTIKHPIVQHILGNSGFYTQTNIEKRKKYSVKEFRHLSSTPEYCPPYNRKASATTRISPKRRRSVTAKTSLKRRVSKQAIPEFGEEEFTAPEYTPDFCRELERNYWRNVTYNPPLYGADMPGILFDETTTTWHLGHLDNILNEINVSLPGVNSPYLYFGMWKATFPWHVEDMDLYSINFIHFGAPKQWYAIPPPQHERFERVAQGFFSHEYKKCSQFLRHKTFHISPTILAHHSIPVYKCVQKEGEFIITFPHGYHSGYNLGYNCAESVNFALENWVEIGKKAKPCKCISDAVTIDVASIFDKKAADNEIKQITPQETFQNLPTDALKGWSVFVQPRTEPGIDNQGKLPVLKLVKRSPSRQVNSMHGDF
ncbi:JmjC-domain-containing protein [Basidiobolus meristosporus CBS 931.73]|uniref:JmjC-domain-containing protein n=1 Tax=Basidiobolus meristosporus CBS 931.73 TaxID=1314790 RepID=A0A1Y1Y6Z3_9FUNG|nr:JmjC-domain-containing protein [Basidiobolus meristosporus CBS 931.73]|eukprot:ORX93354.1 JmjC-domain-containing protein [Basidiobolus meristosporus CBS 931.73]